MKITEIIEVVLAASAIAWIAGVLVSAMYAWMFRKDIKQAEKRFAAQKLRIKPRAPKEPQDIAKHEHEYEMVGAGHP